MALTYEETAALMKDPVFMDRVKISCMKYASYIMLEATSTPAYNTRHKWALQVQAYPEATVTSIIPSPGANSTYVMPTVVMDVQVQTDGAAISDAALQTSVESSVNKLF